jgi:nitrite reductase/ring-hydroxylating ferredoxin subunit
MSKLENHDLFDSQYKFYSVLKLSKIHNGITIAVSVGKWDILLCRYEDNIYALQNLCTHEYRELTGGYLTNGKIVCPFHGACFNLKTGESCNSTASAAIRTFLVRVRDDIIEVAIPEF